MTLTFVCKVSEKCLGLGPECFGLGLGRLGLVSDLKSSLCHVLVSDRNVSYTSLRKKIARM